MILLTSLLVYRTAVVFRVFTVSPCKCDDRCCTFAVVGYASRDVSRVDMLCIRYTVVMSNNGLSLGCWSLALCCETGIAYSTGDDGGDVGRRDEVAAARPGGCSKSGGDQEMRSSEPTRTSPAAAQLPDRSVKRGLRSPGATSPEETAAVVNSPRSGTA